MVRPISASSGTPEEASFRCQKGGVPEKAEIGRTITPFVFSTCALGAPMTAYLHDAVSAAESPCTHVKDHPGLGPPNSLKLLLNEYEKCITNVSKNSSKSSSASSASSPAQPALGCCCCCCPPTRHAGAGRCRTPLFAPA